MIKISIVAAGLFAALTCGCLAGQPVAHCRTSDLSIRGGAAGVAMGIITYKFELTNHGDRICSLQGYPMAAALNGKHEVVPEIHFQPMRPGPGPSGNLPMRVIRLKPGAHAWFEIAGNDGTGPVDLSLCGKSSLVRITPPRNKRPFEELFRFVACEPNAGISYLLSGEPDGQD